MSYCAGKVLCLRVLIDGACPLNDDVLGSAVRGGHLTCVEALHARGLPRKPLSFGSSNWDVRYGGQIRDDGLRCLAYLLDQGCPIHPETLIFAATSGDLDSVRFLHSHGVGLWDAAGEAMGAGWRQMDAFADGPPGMLDKYVQRNKKTICESPDGCDHMWSCLWYGWGMGAPLTPAMEKVVTVGRAATRATLLCFGAATRLSQGDGKPPGHRAASAAMDRMPIELLEKIILLADFEMSESLHRRLPKFINHVPSACSGAIPRRWCG